jgi:hypothetical protein
MKPSILIVALLAAGVVACERRQVRVPSSDPTATPAFTAIPSIVFGPTPHPSQIDWEGRAREVHIGMRRSEVERLLPSYWRPPVAGEDFRRFATTTTITGGGQGVRYHVGEDVVATVHYDYTGVPRDNSGTATSYSSPDNQVTAPVQIERIK